MEEFHSDKRLISRQTVLRLPRYLRFLKALSDEGERTVSATVIANSLSLTPIQVRKDLASVSRISGKPRVGFAIGELMADIENYLGYNSMDQVVLVGVGNLGKALLSYKGFHKYGMHIAAAFDANSEVIGRTFGGNKVHPMGKFYEVCNKANIRIGIIAVPETAAQAVCDLMVRSGILAIMNMAPVHVNVPPGILVENENIATTLALLARDLSQKIDDKEKK